MTAIVSTVLDRSVPASISQNLARRLGPTKFGLWFDRTAVLDFTDRTLRVTVPSRFHAEWIERHFAADLHQAAEEAVGGDLDMVFDVRPEAFALALDEPAGRAAALVAKNDGPRLRLHRPQPDPFDERFDLDRFVVGLSNELAYRTACTVAEGDGAVFGPLFIHGGCGLGKTHLLQGICRRVHARHPAARVRYLTGEQFTNEFIAAVRGGDLETFRKRYRRLDLLALDDVHFLSNKQATQNEFLCTFDAIGLSGARVVLASDEHPRRIKQFHQRLVSRFLAGLVVEVQMPDAATRRQFIERWAGERDLTIHAAALDILVDHCVASMREIEGMLTRMEALRSLLAMDAGNGPSQSGAPQGKEIGVLLVRRLFAGSDPVAPRQVRVEAILEAVAERLGVSVRQIAGESRHRQVVLARSLAAYLARKLTAMSFPEIARAMGRPNHSTIVTACRRIEQEIARGVEIAPAGGGEGAKAVSLAYVVDHLRATLSRGTAPRSDG